MNKPHKLIDAFNLQAYYCRDLGSPFMGEMCETFAQHLTPDSEVAKVLFDWPGDVTAAAASLPLRLMGCLHRLVIAGDSPELATVFPPNSGVSNPWPVFEHALISHREAILEQLKQAPQTNEVRRSGILLPGFMTIAEQTGNLPMMMSELGASAGLNLYWDQFHYTVGDENWGLTTSPISLAPRWSGPAVPMHDLTIADRAGCDLNPIDLDDELAVQTLLSYLWADQPERIDRTRAAIDIFNAHDTQIIKSGAIQWLQHRLARNTNNHVHVIYHTIARQYFSKTDKDESQSLIEAAGARATASSPLAWLRFEADGQKPGAALTLRLWPGGDEQFLGRADYHGRWIDWAG